MSFFESSTYRVTGVGRHYHNRSFTVHEHRAPTDESVRLLKEFEETARAKIEASFRLKDCPLDVAVTVYRDVLNDVYVVAMRYCINGQPRKAELPVPRIEYANLDSIAKRMQQALVTDLSQYILTQCFDDVVAAAVAR